MNRNEVRQEAQQMLGLMPGFIEALPDQHIGALWEHFRNVQLRPGQIPPKYQQLIMLGVATYAKCKYCTDFHTEIAKTLGATQEEIAETALLVGLTANFSNILGGTQYDLDKFKREVREACKHMSGNGDARTTAPKPAAQARPR
jgi:AhpD family alkylhydroperoxidase